MNVLIANWRVIPEGLLVTVEVATVSIILGTPIGIFIGVCLKYGGWLSRALARTYVDLLRGLPLLVTIFAIFYGPTAFGIAIPSILSVMIALALFAGAHCAEITRGAINSIPTEQFEAATSIGLSKWAGLICVILPQAARSAVPPWTNLCVEIVKGTALVSLVGVADLLLSARHVIERTHASISLYAAVGITYFVLNFGVSRLGALIERHFSYH
jgi:polar amino acid transport system permease protein